MSNLSLITIIPVLMLTVSNVYASSEIVDPIMLEDGSKCPDKYTRTTDGTKCVKKSVDCDLDPDNSVQVKEV
jgi:hypothetical protein